MSADSLSAAARRPLHTRQIHCRGFVREDGLYDIEGTLTDVRDADVTLRSKVVPSGAFIHRMTLCLTVDTQFVIHAAVARMDDTPYEACKRIEVAYRALVGLRIEPGFNDRARRLFRGTAGCSHLTELIPVVATTVFQVLWGEREPDAGTGPHTPLGGCHALRLDGEVVRQYFPELPQDGQR